MASGRLGIPVTGGYSPVVDIMGNPHVHAVLVGPVLDSSALQMPAYVHVASIYHNNSVGV
jgi:hypothetical protein